MADKYSLPISRNLDTIDRRYDPEHDLILGQPEVTHTDSLLADCIAALVHYIEYLERRIEVLEHKEADSE